MFLKKLFIRTKFNKMADESVPPQGWKSPDN